MYICTKNTLMRCDNLAKRTIILIYIAEWNFVRRQKVYSKISTPFEKFSKITYINMHYTNLG